MVDGTEEVGCHLEEVGMLEVNRHQVVELSGVDLQHNDQDIEEADQTEAVTTEVDHQSVVIIKYTLQDSDVELPKVT